MAVSKRSRYISEKNPGGSYYRIASIRGIRALSYNGDNVPYNIHYGQTGKIQRNRKKKKIRRKLKPPVISCPKTTITENFILRRAPVG